MKSIITELAKQQIRQIAKYIRSEFGKDRRDEFIKEVRQTRRLIERSPNIGPVEPLLAERAVTYRSYVMNRLNKIVYRIDGDIIYIVAFWDVRRDPITLTNEVK
jgi:plasmid stabilization system protein ParE